MNRKEIASWLYDKLDGMVASGAFAGMRMLRDQPWEDGNLSLKLLGCYESYLHEHIIEFINPPPKRVLDIGSAEGFYAVGIARLLRREHTTIFASDVLAECREVCRQNAELNKVRVVQLSQLTPANLSMLAEHGSLIIMDCEADEGEMADPMNVPRLKDCNLIIECHDFMRRGVTPFLLDKLRITHHVKLVKAYDKPAGEFPVLNELPEVDRTIAVTEQRPRDTNFIVARSKRYVPNTSSHAY